MTSILEFLKYTFIVVVLAAVIIGLYTRNMRIQRDEEDVDTQQNMGDKLTDVKEEIEEDVRDVISKIERPFKKIAREVKADIADLSTIQRRSGRGYCYIGTDRGYRSCIYVGGNDKCMSEEIYPNRDICVNPKLRM